jgi:predicted DNA-binding protein
MPTSPTLVVMLRAETGRALDDIERKTGRGRADWARAFLFEAFAEKTGQLFEFKPSHGVTTRKTELRRKRSARARFPVSITIAMPSDARQAIDDAAWNASRPSSALGRDLIERGLASYLAENAAPSC